MRRIILAISGASGMPLAATLIRALSAHKDVELHLIVSKAAELVLSHEHTLPSTSQEITSHFSVKFSPDTPNLERSAVSSFTSPSVPSLEQNGNFSSQEILASFTLADVHHDISDFSAGPASGSWRHHGMIVCPCSMASLAAIATGMGSNLIHRAADVTLKERRPLVLVTRETPLSRVHLHNMLAASEAGAIIMPPCPAFYTQPQSIQDILDHTAGRILDQIDINHTLGKRWREG